MSGPNVTSNPLPNHPEPKINALIENSTRSMKAWVSNFKMPMKSVYEMLVQAKVLYLEKIKMIKVKEQNGTICNQFCQYHVNQAGHTI